MMYTKFFPENQFSWEIFPKFMRHIRSILSRPKNIHFLLNLKDIFKML